MDMEVVYARYHKEFVQIENEYKICGACGTMYGTANPPSECQICSDERQYGVPKSGQSWGTHSQMEKCGPTYSLVFRQVEKNLVEIMFSPRNQRCFLIINPMGNILWGCTTFVDAAAEARIKKMGGIRAIAISHPHELYSYAKWAMMYKSPVYIHERDKNLIVHNSEFIELWDGEELQICSAIRVIRLGGHFDGGAILHWMNSGEFQDRKGVILCSDMLQVGEDEQTVSIMRSFHNFIPLSEADAQRILYKLVCLEFERIYASGNHRDLLANAKVLATMSLEKYANAIRIADDEKDELGAVADTYRPSAPAAGGSSAAQGQPYN